MFHSPSPAAAERRQRAAWLVALAALIVAIIVVGCIASAANPSAPAPSPIVDYATGQPVSPPLCLHDKTGGFPVAAAAAEYAGIVDVVVRDNCDGYPSRVLVQTTMTQDPWSGWYSPPAEYRGGAAMIQLNLSQAYRHTPTTWRLCLVHEIGHALGLDHTYEAESIMHPYDYAHRAGLSDADRDQLFKLYRREGA